MFELFVGDLLKNPKYAPIESKIKIITEFMTLFKVKCNKACTGIMTLNVHLQESETLYISCTMANTLTHPTEMEPCITMN
jgi:hypothetical protein